MTKSEIFAEAWELAECGVRDFGGSKKEYFAEALRIVYADMKAHSEVVQEQKRQALINELEKIMRADSDANQAKVSWYLNGMRGNSKFTIAKISEIMEMAKAKAAA